MQRIQNLDSNCISKHSVISSIDQQREKGRDLGMVEAWRGNHGATNGGIRCSGERARTTLESTASHPASGAASRTTSSGGTGRTAAARQGANPKQRRVHSFARGGTYESGCSVVGLGCSCRLAAVARQWAENYLKKLNWAASAGPSKNRLGAAVERAEICSSARPIFLSGRAESGRAGASFGPSRKARSSAQS